MEEHIHLRNEKEYRLNIKLADRSLRSTLRWQVLDHSNKHYGCFWNADTLRYDQSFTCGMLGTFASAYSHPDSRFFHSGILAHRMEAMSKYITKVQHPDGSIDLTISNIWSAPDTGFAVRPVSVAYRLLRSVDTMWAKEICDNLSTFLRKARYCLAHGQVHTPNHRWVVVAAMGDINSLFPSKGLRSASEDYLSDGIDVNKEGMYIYERSNSTYNWISNKAIIDIAKFWGKPWVLKYVRRNLDFMLFNVHPNGEVVDEYSRRQDRGSHALLSAAAFDCYMRMALEDKNAQYASMADLAFRLGIARGGSPAGYMSQELFSEFQRLPRSAPPIGYVKPFPVSGIVRIRKRNLSATIMADNFNNVFTVRNGSAIVDSVKIRYNYWGWWNFNPKSIHNRGGTYTLVDIFKGRVFHAGPREVNLRANFKILSEIEMLRDGFSMKLKTRGADDIVMQVDIGLRPSGLLHLKRTKYHLQNVRKPIYFDSKEAVVENGDDRMLIEGGLVQHRIWNGWRGFDPWERYGKRMISLLITPVSPVNIEIRFIAC